MNQDKILITASDNIPLSEIEKQMGVVDSQIVVGANIFRDVFAGFRDLFGGETKGYKKDIDKMKKAAISNLKEQAKEKGANAIISLRIDLDEVSGGGKSMFMLNTYGSAVKIKAETFEDESAISSLDEVDHYKTRFELKQKVETSNDIFREIELDSITKYNLWDLETTKKVFNSFNKAPYDIREKFDAQINEIPLEVLESYLNKNLDQVALNLWEFIYSSLEERGWCDYSFLKQNLKDKNHIKRFRALQLCTIRKKFYSKEDIKKHQELANYIENGFDSSIPTEIVTKMINKKEIYTCPNCLKENTANSNYCDSCRANRLGLKPKSLTPEVITRDLNYSKSN